MDFFVVRRVRVRPEFASLYPELVPSVWMSAAKAVRLIRQADPMQQRVQGCACRRIMCEAHFEFRGGARRTAANGTWQPRTEYKGPYRLGTDRVLS
ncbi:MAG TPA: hypothetical protein VH764_07265 [Gemmatimonadales bacterium]|jgi:hypothetical protein